MTTQEAIEKIKHIQNGLANYTFFNPTIEACLPLADALGMAIAALEAQIPRLLNIVELDEMKGSAVWIENKFWNGYDRWEVWQGFMTTALFNYYGNAWRCWSDKPTAEQMAATPWEKKEG